MTDADRQRWDEKYQSASAAAAPAPNPWLLERIRDLPPGRALDLACGLGANAIAIALAGWEVTGIDISPVGLATAAEAATSQGASIDWQEADLEQLTLPAAGYDLITLFRFLGRDRLPGQIERALKPGGLLLYETFVEGKPVGHVRNPAYVLKRGEAPALFPNLEVIESAEIVVDGTSFARLCARRPAMNE